VQAGDLALLATGSDDETLRLWDPVDGSCVLTVPVHHAVSAVTLVAGSLAVGLEAGVLVIKFESDALGLQ
jgi:WD40 repeat protein